VASSSTVHSHAVRRQLQQQSSEAGRQVGWRAV